MRGHQFAIALALVTVSGRAQAQLRPPPIAFTPASTAMAVNHAVTPETPGPNTRRPVRMRSASRHKSPGLAWFLSFVIAGGGQAYNGQWGKAAGFLVPTVAGIALISSGGGVVFSSDPGSVNAGVALILVSSVWSQIDAPISASRINRDAARPPASTPPASVTIVTIRF